MSHPNKKRLRRSEAVWEPLPEPLCSVDSVQVVVPFQLPPMVVSVMEPEPTLR